MARGHGGKRAGAGKKKGTLWPSTIDKAFQRERLRALVVARLDIMTEAQIRAAEGVKVAVVRRKDGTYRRIDSPEAFDTAVAREELIEVQTIQPSTQAYTDLMNRALDKPAEQLKVTGGDGGPLEIIVKCPW